MPRKKKLFLKDNINWILPTIAIVIFLLLIYISATLETENNGEKQVREFLYHILRDTAIGFLVAALVGFMYETISRYRHDTETIEGVLTAAMGDRIGSDVWEQVNSQILDKKRARESVSINLIAEKNPAFEHQLILSVSFEYKLIGLRATTAENQRITHFLDAHIKQGDLPKFEFIKVGDEVYLDEKKEINKHRVDKHGKFTCYVDLKPDSAEPILVQTMRKEIVSFPGSYHLVMGDITKGITILLATSPDDVEAFINIRPHINNETLLEKLTPFKNEDIMFLPGQGIEFRFKRELPAGKEMPKTQAPKKSGKVEIVKEASSSETISVEAEKPGTSESRKD